LRKGPSYRWIEPVNPMAIILETARLQIRPVALADRDDLVALERDPEVMRFLNGGRPPPLDGIDENAGYLMPRGGEAGIWTAAERASGLFAGWFSLRSDQAGAAELGFRLRRAMWGRGYATEGARALIQIGFTDLGYRLIRAETMAVNAASRRVLEKAGLSHVRTKYPDWPDPLPGSEHGEVEYRITLDEWRAANGG
jgi:RimJ/RimL family protein N-acetyltransferase